MSLREIVDRLETFRQELFLNTLGTATADI